MLESFDNEPPASALATAPASNGLNASAAGRESTAISFSPPQQGVLTRLFVRRWLILLFLAIILALTLHCGLPWQAALSASIAFSCGAALLPRSGLPVFPRPAAPPDETLPVQIATSLVVALPESAILLAGDGTILSFNSQARDLLGGLRAGSHLSSATRSPQVLDAVAECSPARPLATVTLCDRVPVERHLAVTVSWLNLGPARTPSILLFLRDLTAQRRLDQLRSDFIANASHEIKTPLASLLGFIETLQGAARHDEAARDRFLAIMAKQGQRMARLIDNLMSLSRVEMRAHLKPQDTVMICELVQQTCDTLEPMAAEANIQVTAQAEAKGAAVLGDYDELTQVILNLLHNAIKYGRPGGTVQVGVRRVQSGSSSMIEIAVEDDGPGIPGQYLPRLTERFYRVPGPAALEKGGTGLGLAIVKHVVNRHRGEFRIFSEEGAGSRFTVLLAEHEAHEERAGPGPATPEFSFHDPQIW
jgi:two-component system, OmpR family, phosphate regulon sensor histidine kinase PhoR